MACKTPSNPVLYVQSVQRDHFPSTLFQILNSSSILVYLLMVIVFYRFRINPYFHNKNYRYRNHNVSTVYLAIILNIISKLILNGLSYSLLLPHNIWFIKFGLIKIKDMYERFSKLVYLCLPLHWNKFNIKKKKLQIFFSRLTGFLLFFTVVSSISQKL